MSRLLPELVTLDPGPHKYYDIYGSEYTSISSIKKMLVEPFDAERTSYFSARKQLRIEYKAAGRIGEPAESEIQLRAKVLKIQWAATNKDGIDSGNVVHDAAEQYLKYKLLPADEKLSGAVKKVCDTVILPGVQQLYSEEVLYSKKYYMAGTADVLAQVKGGQFPVINIDDFKTNKSKGIQYYSEYGNWMLGPVSHLEQCSYNDYALQLSLYGFMLEEHGYRPGRMRLIYMHPDRPDEYEVIPIPYMRETVLNILSYLEAEGKLHLRQPQIEWA
jgi:hypothetical protein